MKVNNKKNELLNIAYELFITKGYENTSVDEIIAKSGIAKGTFYYYFESKEQTLEEVIDMMLSKESEMAENILHSGLPIENKLVGIIASMRPNNNEVKMQDVINKPENILMHKKINDKIISLLTPILSEVINEGIKKQIFNCDNIEERIKIILIMSSELFDEEVESDKTIDVFIDTIEQILGAKKGTMEFIKQLIIKEN